MFRTIFSFFFKVVNFKIFNVRTKEGNMQPFLSLPRWSLWTQIQIGKMSFRTNLCPSLPSKKCPNPFHFFNNELRRSHCPIFRSSKVRIRVLQTRNRLARTTKFERHSQTSLARNCFHACSSGWTSNSHNTWRRWQFCLSNLRSSHWKLEQPKMTWVEKKSTTPLETEA